MQCLLIAAAVLNITPLRAGLIVYTDKAAFLAATTSAATIGFAGIAPSGGIADFSSTPGGLTIDSVNFQGPDLLCPGFGTPCFPGATLFVADELDAIWAFGVPAVLVGPVDMPGTGTTDETTTDAHLDITPPPGARAFGLDVGVGAGNPGNYLGVTADGVTTNLYPGLQPASAFIGFISNTPLSDIQIVSLDTFGKPTLLDVITATAPPTPEPATWMLVVLPLILPAVRATRRGRSRGEATTLSRSWLRSHRRPISG
jgi:hypothetical protein